MIDRTNGSPSDSRGVVPAVCRLSRLLPDEGSVGLTAIDKRPVDGPVHVHALGLRADLQANRRYHGGPEKALYAYGQDDADWWAGELGREIPPGLFGENLRVQGIAVSRALIGERWAVGDVLLEVTQPRTPCPTFAHRMGEEEDWIRRFTDANRTGCYLRVLREGELSAGDAVEVVRRPAHAVSVADWFEAYTRRGSEPAAFVDVARRLLAAEDDGDLRLTEDIRSRARAALAAS